MGKIKSTVKKVGILGGTFNPVHYGHLIMAQFAMSAAGLDEVLFVPNGNPPHKRFCAVTDKLLRFEMTRLAICDNPAFSISDWEIMRNAPSYSIELIRHLKLCADSEFYFIIGADSFYQIETWFDFENFVKECKIIVANRNITGGENVLNDIKLFEKKYDATVIYVEMPAVDISSSLIRRRVFAGESIHYLTPPCVIDFIMKHNLYTEKED